MPDNLDINGCYVDNDDGGEYQICDKCGKFERVSDNNKGKRTGDWNYGDGEKINEMWNHRYFLFSGVRWPEEMPACLCLNCYKNLMPHFYRIRDAIELDIFVNRLGKAINEKRKRNKDNGAAKDNAC